MKLIHIAIGVLSLALMGGAAIWGAWCWYRVRQSRLFWRLLRIGQAVVVLEIALGGVLLLMGRKESDLHLIYGLLPLMVSFLAEQLRIASAQMVLDSRGFQSSTEVGTLPETEQRLVVLSIVPIVQRELAVMVLAAAVIVVLLIRAAGTGG
jgi:hypothetical protein